MEAAIASAASIARARAAAVPVTAVVAAATSSVFRWFAGRRSGSLYYYSS